MSDARTIDRGALVAEAMSWLGTPYRHQASLKGAGCDCLGLIRGVWRALLGDEPEPVPAYTPDWAEARGEETLADAGRRHFLPVALGDAAAGDVLLFRWRENLPAKHAAILIGADRFIHAQQGAAVATAALTPWWRRRATAAFRFPGTDAPPFTGELSAKPTEGAAARAAFATRLSGVLVADLSPGVAPSTPLRAVPLPRFTGEDH